MRKSWCTIGLGLVLVLCLAGCQILFPRPVYTPPEVPPPQAPPPPAQIAHPTFYVAGDRVNLRANPGLDSPKIAILDRNQEVEKVVDAVDWSQIRIKRDGTIGWVSSQYLSATPVTAPAGLAQPTPPPLPEKPEKPKPTLEKPPAPEKPVKPAKPGGVTPPPVKKKPEEAQPPRPAKSVKPSEEGAPVPEKPLKPEKRVKPAPERPVLKPTPPGKPAPPTSPELEKPSQIKIM
jgi:hypothetical protein